MQRLAYVGAAVVDHWIGVVAPAAMMGHEEYSGLRITPNVYSTAGDIDLFADTVEKELKSA